MEEQDANNHLPALLEERLYLLEQLAGHPVLCRILVVNGQLVLFDTQYPDAETLETPIPQAQFGMSPGTLLKVLETSVRKTEQAARQDLV